MSESDHMAATQAIDMMYNDNGYDTAKQLLSGRHTGVNAALDVANADKRDPDSRNNQHIPEGSTSVDMGMAAGAAAKPTVGEGSEKPMISAADAASGVAGITGSEATMKPSATGIDWSGAPLQYDTDPGFAANAQGRSPTAMFGTNQETTPGGTRPSMEGAVLQNGDQLQQYLKNRTTRMTKDQVQAMNSSRYAGAM